MKVWALILVIALGIFGWVLPARAGKVMMTDQELDGVSGGAKSVVTVVTGNSSATAAGKSAAAVVTPVGSAAAANFGCCAFRFFNRHR